VIVRKRALSPAALDNLLSLPKKRAKLSVLEGLVRVGPVWLDGDSVVSDFIAGDNLGMVFEEALVRRDSGAMIALCQKVLAIIDQLPLTSVEYGSDHPFTSVFGRSFEGTHKSVQVGFIDFNLDNFIEKDGELHLIDYEWLFDFPVPAQFVVQRLFFSFFGEFANMIAYLCDERMPVVELARGFYLPAAIYNAFDDRLGEPANTIAAENAFQAYVHLKGQVPDMTVLSEPRFHTRPQYRTELQRRDAALASAMEGLEAYKRHATALEERMLAIERSWPWRMAKAGRSIVRRFKL
jgi:hypothetical protein